MSRLRTILALTMVLFLLAVPVIGVSAQDATPSADHSDIEIAYVLHGLNTFTERKKLWTKLAGKDLGVTATSRNWATVEALLELADA